MDKKQNQIKNIFEQGFNFAADFEGFFRNRYEYFVNSAYAGFSGKAEKGRTAEKKQKNLRKFKTWKEKFLFLN